MGSNAGTKAVFKSWLQVNKHMTITKYTKLSPEQKAFIQEEYRDRNKQSVKQAGA